MQLLKMPDDNCFVYSFCMVTGEDPKSVFEYIGHRGQEIWWPPDGKRGIHFQELLDYALDNGYCMPIIDPIPESQHPGFEESREVPSGLFTHAVSMYDGILVNIGHARAWDSTHQHAYDPNGYIIEETQLILKSAHIFIPIFRIKSQAKK